MLQTRKSNPNKPARLLVYGPEGVGKTTLGAKSDRPVFISPEGGTDQVTDADGNPVDEMPGINSWVSLKAAIAALTSEQHDFKTVVIDSVDWVESLAHSHIIGKTSKNIVTVDGGYGAGLRRSKDLHKELIDDLSILRDKRDMNVILIGHAHVKTVKDPEAMEDYDAFEIKCHEYVSSLWREWVDGLFFVRFKTILKSGDSAKARAFTDGSRVLYTTKQPAFQAKNRYGMPTEMDFTEGFWKEFVSYKAKGVQQVSLEEVMAEIGDLLPKVSEDLRETVENTIRMADKNVNKLIAIRDRIKAVASK